MEFVFESEAVGHWLLRLNKAKRQYEKTKRLVLADFGGHTMVSHRYFAQSASNMTYANGIILERCIL